MTMSNLTMMMIMISILVLTLISLIIEVGPFLTEDTLSLTDPSHI